MSAFSGSHFSIVLASTNGGLCVWTARPNKLIQPLAPNFVEIEDNVEYVEREDEFETEKKGPAPDDKHTSVVGIEPLSDNQLRMQDPVEIVEPPTLESHLQVQVAWDDSFGVLARQHIQQLREKFNGLLP